MAKLVTRTRRATGLDVTQVQRVPDGSGTVLFTTSNGKLGYWRIRTGEAGLIEP